MVKLNKPVRFPKKEEQSVDESKNVSNEGIDENVDKTEKEDPSEEKSIYDRFDFVLTGLCVFLALISVGVLVFAVFSFVSIEKSEYLKVASKQPDKSYFSPELSKIESWNKHNGIKSEVNDIGAKSFLAYNPITHQVYFSKAIDEPVPIASITKLLTALVALEEMEMDQDLVAQREYDRVLDWTLGLRPGDKLTLENALNAMLISSYNDAAYLVADNYPGGFDGMIEAMNQKAEKLGMESSSFNNPSGLDNDELFSTSRDLKRLIQEVIKSEEIMTIVSKQSEVIEIERNIASTAVLGEQESDIDLEEELWGIGTIPYDEYEEAEYTSDELTIYTSNELLGSDTYIRGLKTGYTEAAGPSFVSYYLVDDEEQLITILLSADGDRFEETSKLVEMVREAY